MVVPARGTPRRSRRGDPVAGTHNHRLWNMGPRLRIPLRKGCRSLIEAEGGGGGQQEHLEALPLSRLRAAHRIGSAHSGTLEDRCSAQIVNSGEDKDVGGNIAQTWRAGARQTV